MQRESETRVTIKAVIFDLDGTIAAFNLDYKALRAEAKSYLMKKGVPASLLSIKENIFEMLTKTELFVHNAQKPAGTMEEIRKEVLQLAEKFELEASAQTSLIPGSLETLKELRAMGLKIGLCTLNSLNSTKLILKRFKLTPYFDTVVTRNQVSNYKPNPEHCNVAVAKLGVAASETVFVGDSPTDMQAAAEAKATAVGLSMGTFTKRALMNQGANFVITSITDLPLLIEGINKAADMTV